MPVVVDFAQVLTAAGQTVAGDDGWRTRAHPGTFAPVGILWHHTAGDNALDVVINGRADLAGPLCHLYLDREGTWWPVAAGVAWHAGPGSQTVLDELSAGKPHSGDAAARGLPDDCHTGNERLIGIEVEWAEGQDWPQVQIDALVAGSAALLAHLGLNENHCRHHRQWTSRKQDMAYTGDLWAAVHQLLNPAPPAPTEETDVIIVIRAPGRTAAFLTPDGVGHPMSSAKWSAVNHLAKAAPDRVTFAVLTDVDHDAFTGKAATT